MESEARYVFVGAIVTVLTICVATFVLWLTKTGATANYKRYTVYFEHQGLEGLQVNSYVTMKGIKVGSVEKLMIDPKNSERVIVTLLLEETAPVSLETKANINRNLLTGLAGIDLRGGGERAEKLTQILPGEPYPIIPEGKSKLEQVAESIPQLMSKSSDVLARVELALSDENLDSVSATLRNAERVSRALGESEQEIKGVISNVHSVSADVRDASKRLGNLSDKGAKMIDTYSEQLSELIERFSNLVARLDSEGVDAVRTVGSSAKIITQDVEQMTQSLNRASAALAGAAEGLSDLKRDLSSNAKNGPGEGMSEGR